MGYTGPLPQVVKAGGTGAATLTGVLVGSGTSAVTGNTITQHDVLVGGASNAITSVAPSTSGYVLTSNGPGADPSFQAASNSGQGWVLIQTLTANNSANLIFSTGITATYTNYAVIISQMLSVSGGQNIAMQYSINGGSTFVNSGYSGQNQAIGTSGISLWPGSYAIVCSSQTSGIGGAATFYLYGVTNGLGCNTQGINVLNGGAAAFGGILGNSSAINAFSFFMQSGNILSGSISLYGIKS